MTTRQRLWVLSFLILAKACSRGEPMNGDHTSAGTSGGIVTGAGGAPPACPPPDTHGTKAKVPVDHRAAAVTCAASDRPPGTCAQTRGVRPTSACTRDPDCAAGINGRCQFGSQGSGGDSGSDCFCEYDDCLVDADCHTGGPCQCAPSKDAGATTTRNVCLYGNCRTDADCGEGYCSPSDSGTNCGGFRNGHGYFCHTAQDTCVNDADCIGASGAPGLGPAPCAFGASSNCNGLWVCVAGCSG
jgi:hypothetical protein